MDEEKLVSHIAVLSEFAHLAPDAFEEQSEAIMTFLVKKVLMTPAPPDPVSLFFLSLPLKSDSHLYLCRLTGIVCITE